MKKFNNLYSHPDKLLLNHLEDVGKLCNFIISEKRINFPNIDNKKLNGIVSILGACHDFGKSTKFFQDYIKEEEIKIRMILKEKPQTNHGIFSAVFTYFVMKHYIRSENIEDGKFPYIPIFGYLIVKRHHGNLKNPSNEIVDLDEEQKEIIYEQIGSIDKPKIIEIYKKLLPNIDIRDFFDNIESIIGEILINKRKFLNFLKNEDSLYLYTLFQILFSTLINSDKMEASGIIKLDKKNISSNIIDKYRSIKFANAEKSKINDIRNRIYNEVIYNIQNINLDDKIYSINVPTGTAKTLASLSSAIKLRDKIKNQRGFIPKIIYCLPFLSIIDQSFDIFEDVFETTNGKKPTTDILLKHHHLADIYYETEEDEFKVDEALFMIEGWNSELIVTTFVQFFHTIISRKNRSLRKFCNIANSIVILDEVQSIPHEFWLLFREMITAISVYLNTYFIFVTATQPLIFDENKKEIIELAPNKKNYFDQFDRIQLQYFQNPKHIEEFKKILIRDITKYNHESFLIVLNTIRSSKEIYKFLRDSIKEIGKDNDNIYIVDKENNTEYYYLSTHIIPKQRLERIRSIKNSRNRKIIVSTQLIEAGVDINVDKIYRDMATLDSITQVAGRCNRNDEGKKGDVRIFTLKDDNTEYNRYIYSNFLIEKTKEVFKDTNTISENQFLELNDAYFHKVNENKSNDKAIKLLGYIKGLRFENIGKEFLLIDIQYEKVDVFVEIDDNACDIWNKFIMIRNINNILERRNLFLDIKKQFYDYIISVPKDRAPPKSDPITGIRFISKDDLKNHYDKEIGFIDSET